MNAGEAAALVTALGISFGAIITAIATLINARVNVRNSKAEDAKLKAEIGELKEHNHYQDSLLIDREIMISNLTKERDAAKKQIEELQDKIKKWHEWGFNVGRIMNGLQLEVGSLKQSGKSQTGPLPALPESDTTIESE